MDTRIKEAIRYLGYGRHTIDEVTFSLIQESFRELEKNADDKFIYRILGITHISADELKIGKMHVKSESLCKNLKECDKAILLGVTLGAEIDRKMQRYELLDMSMAVVFQAAAATYLEECCDEIVEGIKQEAIRQGEYLRPRFSPGYGDFSILHQKEILDILDAPKCIGLTMTDSFMLTPTKSVTAVIGISKTKGICQGKSCAYCSKIDCLYRRS